MDEYIRAIIVLLNNGTAGITEGLRACKHPERMIREAAHFRAIHPKNEDHEEDWALFLPPPPVDSEHSSDTNPNY